MSCLEERGPREKLSSSQGERHGPGSCAGAVGEVGSFGVLRHPAGGRDAVEFILLLLLHVRMEALSFPKRGLRRVRFNLSVRCNSMAWLRSAELGSVLCSLSFYLCQIQTG